MLALLWLIACGGDEERLPPPTDPVVAVALAQEPVETVRRTWVSTVEARQDAVLAAKVAGTVEEVLVAPGDAVVARQALLRLDGRQARANLHQAKAALADAEAVLESAGRSLTRLEALGDAVAPATLDDGRTGLSRATAARDAAQAQVELASLAVEWSTIRAPFAGTVAALEPDVGELVGQGTPVGRVVDQTGFEVRISLLEDAVRTARDPRTRFAVIEGPHRWEAILQSLSPAADPRTQAWHAVLELSPGEGLLAGLPVTVEAELAQPTAQARLPLRAVQDGAVWVVVDGKATRRQVTVIAEGTPEMLVDGVAPGDRVILRGPADLAEGRAVQVVEGAP